MRILLVEDDPTTAKSIEMMLTHANLNIYWTDLGEEQLIWQNCMITTFFSLISICQTWMDMMCCGICAWPGSKHLF